MTTVTEDTNLLDQIRENQIKQSQIITELRNQNDMLVQFLSDLTDNRDGVHDGLVHVKIENINVPFWSLVGFLLKLSFASIPAGLVIGILWFVLFIIITGIGLMPFMF